MPNHAARPRLVVDNSSRIGLRPRILDEMRLEFFKRAGGEVAASLDSLEKLSVVDDDCRKTSFRDSRAQTELFCILQKLLSQGHFSSTPVWLGNHAVFIPQKSTGFVPRAKLDQLRDSSLAMSTLIERIDECLGEKHWKPRRASLEAGLGPDFIREIKRKRSRDPRPQNLDKLAKVFDRSYTWLATGKGAKERYDGITDDREKRIIRHFRSMTPERQTVYDDMGAELADPEKLTG